MVWSVLETGQKRFKGVISQNKSTFVGAVSSVDPLLRLLTSTLPTEAA